MNRLVPILILAAATALMQSVFPWWTLLITCGLFGFLYGPKAGWSFIIGFLAVALVWLTASLWIRIDAGPALSDQVARIFPGGSVGILFSLTALVGGLAGGMASWAGYEVRRLL